MYTVRNQIICAARRMAPMWISLLGMLACADVNVHAEEAHAITFEEDVRPILKAHCWQCHGEEAELKGGFDTRLARFILRGGDSGTAVSKSGHKDSLIWQRIASGEMPPGPKRLSPEDTAMIAAWIDAGAGTLREEPESLAHEGHFTEEDRSHWSFQPVVRPAFPPIKGGSFIQSPIDMFILARLEAEGLSFSPMADKATLIRRLYINLLGLPPSPEAIERFLREDHPESYARLVEQLLTSPTYGERWARHWLDVAGYADSDGVTKRDTVRAWAFKYRDYVIDALNENKPWDEFLVEQLAGDELVSRPYRDLDSSEAQKLIATGFLRMSPDGTSGDVLDQELARNQAVAEVIKSVSTSLLGLSVGCAQCHSHRYDAISHTDYYRMRALFEPAYNWKDWRSPGARLISQWSAATEAEDTALQQEASALTENRDKELDEVAESIVQKRILELPEDIQEAARAARSTPADERTAEQSKIIEDHAFLKVTGASLQEIDGGAKNEIVEKWDPKIAEVNSRRPPRDYLMPLTEVAGSVPVTFLFNRGDHKQPQKEVLPGGLSIIAPPELNIPVDDPELPSTGRRLAYARYLTNGSHPLVARVLVNRIWMHHFGSALVSTPGDFGTQGERPSHPELLDWLAAEFVDSGWDLKHLHRLILCSTVYQQTAVRSDLLQRVDPENQLLGRMSVRRLESEVLRDSLLSLSGQLQQKMGGPAAPVSLDNVGQRVVVSRTQYDPSGRLLRDVESVGEDKYRRTIYIQVRRSLPLGILVPFDIPTLNPNCTKRTVSNNAPQSLQMMNDPFVIEQVNAIAARLIDEVGDDIPGQIARAWRLIIGKSPSKFQMENAIAFLSDLEFELRSEGDDDAPTTHQKALAQLCQALVASNGFLYVE